MLHQQGDVLIETAGKVEGGRLNHLVLAQGEATGHCHAITLGDAELYGDENGNPTGLEVKSDRAVQEHQEHNPVILPRETYNIRKVREYDHFQEEARNVRD